MSYDEVFNVIRILSENTIDISNEYVELKKENKNKQKNNLIYPKLPTNMSEKNKNNRVRYIISQLKKENKIENEGSLTKSSWIIKK